MSLLQAECSPQNNFEDYLQQIENISKQKMRIYGMIVDKIERYK